MSLDLLVTRPELTTYALAAERTLGGPQYELETRVSIGTAEPYPITANRVTDDPDLAVTLNRYDRHKYYGICLVCSFLGAAPEVVEHATFSVTLSYADPGADDKPIAWSLWPRKLVTKPVHQTKSFKGSIGIKVGIDLRLEGGHSEEADEDQCYVVAAGEREPDPEWRFRRTAKVAALDGVHDLWLVAQVERGREAAVVYGVNAVVRRPKFGISYTRLDIPVPKRTLHLK